MSQIWALQHVPAMVFVFSVGACVGSFLNVVLYRLPLRMSVISPPSRCPTCGHMLSFFRENLPIIGWFLVRGKCRACRSRVSPQYMVVEVAIALLFIGVYALLYLMPSGTGWWINEIGGSWWRFNQFVASVPAFFTIVFLLVGLIAMTVIDARTFTIPIEIPAFVTGTAFVLWPLQFLLTSRMPNAQSWPIHGVTWMWVGAALLGAVGWFVAYTLLRIGRIPYSFADYDDFVEEGETLGEYPHGRREMSKELLFLSPILLGFLLGGAGGLAFSGVPPIWLQAVVAPLVGYFVGCGVVWTVRILGTYAFGREAMGLGDVHLLGAVGAVLGWFDPILVFFIAPFVALIWVFATWIAGRVSGRFGTLFGPVPFGPYLAVATVIVLLARPGIEKAWDVWSPMWPMPAQGFVVPSVPAP